MGRKERGKQKASILLYSPQIISRNDPYYHGSIIRERMNWCLSKLYGFFKWFSHSCKIIGFYEIINSSVSN